MAIISRRQRIITELLSILEGTTKIHGYRTDIGSNVFEWKITNFQDSEIPGIDIRDASEVVVVSGQRHMYTLTVEMEAKVSASVSIVEGRQVIADITTVMGCNFNINNLAHKITPVENDLLDFEQGNKKYGTILMKFEIEYATEAFKPYT